MSRRISSRTLSHLPNLPPALPRLKALVYFESPSPRCPWEDQQTTNTPVLMFVYLVISRLMSSTSPISSLATSMSISQLAGETVRTPYALSGCISHTGADHKINYPPVRTIIYLC